MQYIKDITTTTCKDNRFVSGSSSFPNKGGLSLPTLKLEHIFIYPRTLPPKSFHVPVPKYQLKNNLNVQMNLCNI